MEVAFQSSQIADIDLMFARRESASVPRKLGACKFVKKKKFLLHLLQKVPAKPGT